MGVISTRLKKNGLEDLKECLRLINSCWYNESKSKKSLVFDIRVHRIKRSTKFELKDTQ